MQQIKYIYILILLFGCKERKKATAPELSSKPHVVYDSVVSSLTSKSFDDSILVKQERDSLFALNVVRSFITDQSGDCYDKMVAASIDTGGVKIIPVSFTGKYGYLGKKDDSSRGRFARFLNKRYRVDLEIPAEYGKRKLFINGTELMPGKVLDTSLSGIYP